MNGFLIFNSAWDGEQHRVAVRACPDPAGVRAMFESLLGTPVRWERAR